MSEIAKYAPADAPRPGMPLHTKILIGLVVGTVVGIGVNHFGSNVDELFGRTNIVESWVVNVTEPVGELFLRLLLMVVVPMVFSSLVLGVAGIGDIRKLGRVGLHSFGYTLIISAISVFIGLGLARAIEPGKRIPEETAIKMRERADAADKKDKKDGKAAAPNTDSGFMQAVKTVVPKNPLTASASETPNMLQLMFFALMTGIAVTLLPADKSAALLGVLQSIYDICAVLISLIMKVAPYAVACLLFNSTARFGFDLLAALAWFAGTVLLGLSLHFFGVYSLSVWLVSGLNPITFFRKLKVVIATAFSTSSSNATLPTALRITEEELGIPRPITGFVLTVGATANQNGTALYEGVTILFLAQLAGVELTFGQQLVVVYMAILGGIGTAGVPSGSIPFIAAILPGLGIPASYVVIILGVDRILDMCRTVLNVVGDVTIATYVARVEGIDLNKAGSMKDEA